MRTLIWFLAFVAGDHDGLEPTDRLIPPGWKGNPWGPEATVARAEGRIPPIVKTPEMKKWEAWGKQVLRDGDILFRRGDAKVLRGRFPFSKFIAKASGSLYAHTGIAAIEDGEVVVRLGARQRRAVWREADASRRRVVRSQGGRVLPPEVSRANSVRLRSEDRRQRTLLRRDDREGVSVQRPAAGRSGSAWRHGKRRPVSHHHHGIREALEAHARPGSFLPWQ